MIVLGITDSFTSGAAVVIDGKVVSAINEERLDRNKMSMGFPNRSIAEVLQLANVEPGEIDAVAVATVNLFWRPEAEPYYDPYRGGSRGGLRETYLTMGAELSRFVGNSDTARGAYYRLKSILTRRRRNEIKRVMKEKFGISAPVKYLDHHLCHAASAYFTSGFKDATVITQDGAGDMKCSRVYSVSAGRFRQLTALESYDSVGNYYAYVTHICGYKAHKHEGKITGLAAYGEPTYLDVLRRYVDGRDGVIENKGKCFDKVAIGKIEKSLPKDFSHADLSASVQALLEETVTAYCHHWLEQSGLPNLAVAGGVFANVKLNQHVFELPNVERMFVHPGMGDDGLAVGAALFLHNQLTGYEPQSVLRDVYLGSDVSDAQVERALRNSGLQPTPLKDSLERHVARLLAEGNVVARCVDGMEYGPRALGNRTIMYQPTDPTVNDWLNKRLIRTEFMPFAPVTLWEERHNCFANVDGAEDSARFMTITFDCTQQMKRQCPAVCHVDGTARPQLVREEENPSYYRIVKEYQALTGLPCLINTSFNMHEEPIVRTPEEAINAFEQSALDALILGEHLVYNDRAASLRQGEAAVLVESEKSSERSAATSG